MVFDLSNTPRRDADLTLVGTPRVADPHGVRKRGCCSDTMHESVFRETGNGNAPCLLSPCLDRLRAERAVRQSERPGRTAMKGFPKPLSSTRPGGWVVHGSTHRAGGDCRRGGLGAHHRRVPRFPSFFLYGLPRVQDTAGDSAGVKIRTRGAVGGRPIAVDRARGSFRHAMLSISRAGGRRSGRVARVSGRSDALTSLQAVVGRVQRCRLLRVPSASGRSSLRPAVVHALVWLRRRGSK